MSSNLCLRHVIDSDLPVFFDQQADPVANIMAGFPARDRDSFMDHWKRILGDDSARIRTIVVDSVVAGNIVSFERSGKREVGYWIGRAHWGRGIATKALAAFLLEESRRPLYAGVTRNNVASLRVLKKCGFVICGEEGEHVILELGEVTPEVLAYPDLVQHLPDAEIPFPGVRGKLLQARGHQVVFFDIEAIGAVAPHSHGAQFGVVIEGEMELTIDGVSRTYRKGDAYFIPVGAVHSAVFRARTLAIDVFAEPDRYRARKS